MSHFWKYWLPVGFAIVSPFAAWLALEASNACIQADKHLLPEIQKAASCTEFWMNRYQSIAGNALTAFVAGMTLYWVAGQLKSSNRQAAAAAAQSLRQFAAETALTAEAVDAIDLPDLSFLDGIVMKGDTTNYFRNYISSIEIPWAVIEKKARRSDNGEVEIRGLVAIGSDFPRLLKAAQSAFAEHYNAHYNHFDDRDDPSYDFDETDKLLKSADRVLTDAELAIIAILQKFAEQLDLCRMRIDADMTQIWREVRRLERAAVQLT